jgi:predicted CxxxxCH...CXXCH cytochrome family protein
MVKKYIAFAVLSCLLLPMLAIAAPWSLNTWVRTTGGTIVSRNLATPQTNVNGSVFKSYTTSKTMPVNVFAATGYTISSVTKNGSVVANSGSSYSTTVAGPAAQTIWVNFVQTQISLTATAGPGGTVSPASLTGGVGTQTAPRVFVFTPAAGNNVKSITGLPATGVTLTNAITGSTVTIPAPVNVAVRVSITSIADTTPINLAGTFLLFTPVVANAGTSQTFMAGSSGVVTLNGTVNADHTGPVSYVWVQTAGPSVSLNGATNATATFSVPSVLGTYRFVFTATGQFNSSSASTSVLMTNDPAAAAKTQCADCHALNGVRPEVYGQWASSPHPAGLVLCFNCHVGANAGNHPPPAVSPNFCRNCHVDAQGNVPRHPFAIGTQTCVFCHNPHTTVGTTPTSPSAAHFNNRTGVGYPASYVTSRSTCMDCHFDNPANATVRGQWAQTGHADVNSPPWMTYDFKTRAGCVQCHTTTGFIAYSTGKVTAAWGVATDKTKEVLTCVGCHSDITTGEVRSVTPIKPFADDTYVNRNVGASNICMNCHSGRNNGKSILVKVGVADFSNLAFITPHYMAAGGILHGQGAYNFPGTPPYAFYSSNSHRKIGMVNNNNTGTGGPCVECHMTATQKHLFKAASTDNNGFITSIDTNLCTNCHSTSLTVATLNANQAAFDNAMFVFNAALTSKGFVYTSSYPYFANKDWGTGQSGANVMGAAFNYVLLKHELAAYVHNPAYAKQLVIDSIDAASHNGTVTGSIEDVLAALVRDGKISQEQADGVAAYQTATSCNSCHANTSASHPAHLNAKAGVDFITCAACHQDTASSNTTLVPGTTYHLNGRTDVAIASGVYIPPTCSGVYCHSNGAGAFANPSPVWGGSSLTCLSCHPVSALRGAHAAHIGGLIPTTYGDTGNYSTTTEYRFGCANCHPTTVASHLDGHIDVTLVPTSDGSLRSKNNPSVLIGGIGNTGSGITGTSGSTVVCAASYCHSNGGTGPDLAYVASPNWYGTFTGDRCAMCHTPATTSGAHNAHVSINGIHAGRIADADGNLISGYAAPTILCATCHSTSASADNSVNKTIHLNGIANFSLATVNVVSKAQIAPASFGEYSTIWTRTTYKVDSGSFDISKKALSTGSWNAGTKTCSNIACHNTGTPVWTGGAVSCVTCHTAL